MKAVIENEDKNIGLYYRDRIDYEKTRDDLERAGLSDGFILDETIAQMFAEIAAQQNIDDLQIISLSDPNIKEIVGAEAIAGRAYHVGNGKVVIVAENLQDFADAMGTITEEGRHIYHRNNNNLQDSEDYASFYGKQFENYFNKRAKDTPLYMIGSNLAYNAGQLGNDWENDGFYLGGNFAAGAGIRGGSGSGVYLINTGKGIDAGFGITGSFGGALSADISAGIDYIYFPYATSKNDVSGNYDSISVSVTVKPGIGGSVGVVLYFPSVPINKTNITALKGLGIGISGSVGAGVSSPINISGFHTEGAYSKWKTFDGIAGKTISSFLTYLRKTNSLGMITSAVENYIKKNENEILKKINEKKK